MIRKLRIKFVINSMLVTILVAGTIFGFIRYENYKTTDKKAEAIVNVILENNGEIPEYKPQKNYDGIITMETRFSARYFYAKIDSNGNIVELNLKNIAAISEEQAKNIINQIKLDKKKTGYYRKYKYKVKYSEKGESEIAVLDYSFQLNNFEETTQKAIYIVAGGLSIVFILLTLISKKLLTPIINNIEKQKQFISNAGHELKTPIAVIMANSEVLEMTETSKEKIELIKSTKNQAQRLNELTATLLSLARAEEGRIHNEYTEFSITEMIENEIKDFKALAKDKTIEFKNTDDIKINADKTNIKELIIIFLDNAIKYSNENGIITIKAEKKGKNVKLQFMNTCNNPKDINIKKIFDRFYREDKSRNKEKEGYGIGLSMAKSIVDMHKGKISVDITKDNQICFTIII